VLAEGGQFTPVLGGQFAWIFQIADLSQDQVMDNYYQVKYDIRNLIEKEVTRLLEEKEKSES
jgi:hypothetical protein